MRILEVARQFYPKVGGMESCALNLSRALAARGHHIEVVTLDRDLQTRAQIGGPASVDSIPIHRVPWFGSARYPISPSWLRYARDFDVIHIHATGFFLDSAALQKTFGTTPKPFIVTTHGGIFHTTAFQSIKDVYWQSVLRGSLSAASSVVAVSAADHALFQSIVSPAKLRLIPNGIDAAFSGAETRRARGRIVAVGRVTASKRLDTVLRLFAAVANDFPGAELVIAGPVDSDAAETLARESKALGLDGRVHIRGATPLPELVHLVASAHLFVSAALHEGFGITTVESLAAGVPVLVTRTGVHEEVVRPNMNGWFWSGEPDAQAVATLRDALLLSDARLDEMQLAARGSARPFDWNTATDKYEQLLASACRESMG
ncbi:MAG TPA: glycosyltransferase family 4 protein [Gemmatimonadaceae bacterium]